MKWGKKEKMNQWNNEWNIRVQPRIYHHFPDMSTSRILTLSFNPQGRPRSNLMVPIESHGCLPISAPWGPTSYLSPFSRYFKSKDSDMAFWPLRVIQERKKVIMNEKRKKRQKRKSIFSKNIVCGSSMQTRLMQLSSGTPLHWLLNTNNPSSAFNSPCNQPTSTSMQAIDGN